MNNEQIKVLNKIYSMSQDTHNILTPISICDEMINSLNIEDNKSILVVSNMEFLISLRKHNIDMKNVHYTVSCPIKKQFAENLGIQLNNIHNLEYNKKEINFGTQDMKFDYIAMNPPYGKYHLKFLELSNKLRNTNGQVISIQPLRWFEDPLWIIKNSSPAKKLENVLNGKLEVVREIISNNGNNGFDARFNMNLAIFKISDKTDYKYDNYIDYTMFSIIEKIKSKSNTLNDVLDKNKLDGIRVNLQSITAYTTGKEQYKNRAIWIDGKDEEGNYWCSKKYIKNQYFKPDGTPLPFSIKFDTMLEAENFIDWIKNGGLFDAITKWYKSDVHIRFTEIPFMNNFKRKWTFDDICKYYEFTEIEIETLNKHINKEQRMF